ncbi:hypothetical protein EGW08_017451 [Elysia chlorotica]|uniref:Uncharacterized protein n=1 Tax=Elysia chlorotica TaxID=188477 RepID=A0A3S0ZCT7_ELYCH|nr:hypothetical protein EGW08_017451 [Elysia chlorotica]
MDTGSGRRDQSTASLLNWSIDTFHALTDIPIVMLARAEDEMRDLSRSPNRRAVGKNREEVSTWRHVCQSGRCCWQTQESFWPGHDQRLPEISHHLAQCQDLWYRESRN